MLERKLTCINLTQKMHQCKRKPAIINVRRDGLVTLHCWAHWGKFWGYAASLPEGLSCVRFTLARFHIINNTQDVAARVGLAYSFGIADLDKMLARVNAEGETR